MKPINVNEEKDTAIPSGQIPKDNSLDVDAEHVQYIQERINRLERGERDPHVKDWSGAYYGDVYFLLRLVRRSEQAVNSHDALVAALRQISTGQCESFTTGVGSCARNGRTLDAQYLGEKWCDSCIAESALALTETAP